MRRGARAGLAGLAALALLSGCGSDGKPRNEEVVSYGAGAQPPPTTAPPTTAKPVTTDAPAPSTTTAKPRPTTSTTATPGATQSATGATVTIVSTYPGAVIVELNGISQTVPAHGTVGPVHIRPQDQGADYFRIANDVQTCGGTDSDDYFDFGKSYELRLSPKPGNERCDDTELPLIRAVLHPSGQELL